MGLNDLSDIQNLPGIYCIENIINNKCYIGQSVNVRKRLRVHIYNCKSKRYQNRHLYRAVEKHGIENFKISVLTYITDDLNYEELKNKLNSLEIEYIKSYNSFGNSGYNETEGGDSKPKYLTPDETREKLSTINKHVAEQLKQSALQQYNNCGFVDDYYNSIPTVAMNIETKEFICGFSRSHVAEQINEVYNLNLSASTISRVIEGKILQSSGFVFGNTKEDCLVKLKELQSHPKLKHSYLCAPNYQKYLEYLISVCDDRGFIPTLKELGQHFGRNSTTICGWNKKIKDELELDLKYNRLRLKHYSNPNIHYELQLGLCYKNGNNF